MEIEFDPAKDESNIRKHGISLARAAELDWNECWERCDDRADYGEARYVGLAPLDNRLYVVVYTERGNVMRVISLRKANQREYDDYVRQA
ncbi:BrnT family toxin [Paraburkholderia acidicola]|uniref:BrnT family toxin n=1 Tax=Paraburkholderia acidicola TaxID=1912599 RepID=A0ABV1LUK6_9BURK